MSEVNNGGFVPLSPELTLQIRQAAAERTGTKPEQWWIRDSRATELANKPNVKFKIAGGGGTVGEIVTVAGPGPTVTFVTTHPNGDFSRAKLFFVGEGTRVPL